MRRTTLLSQVIIVNLLLIAVAVVAAAIASSPDSALRETGAAGLVLGFALSATIAANLFLLSRRFEPLERLADEMEHVNLSRPPSAQDRLEIGGAARLPQGGRREAAATGDSPARRGNGGNMLGTDLAACGYLGAQRLDLKGGERIVARGSSGTTPSPWKHAHTCGLASVFEGYGRSIGSVGVIKVRRSAL